MSNFIVSAYNFINLFSVSASLTANFGLVCLPIGYAIINTSVFFVDRLANSSKMVIIALSLIIVSLRKYFDIIHTCIV